MEDTSWRSLFVYFLTGAILLYIVVRSWRKLSIWNVGTSIPGPTSFPFIGCTYLILGCNLSECFIRLNELKKQYGKIVKFWFGNYLIISISEPTIIENIHGSNKFLDRGDIIKLVGKDMFRNGLFTNSGDTWKFHRKIITSMFHRNILDEFVDVYFKNATIFSDAILSKSVNGAPFDVKDYIVLCTLDIIYETVLGTTIDAQKNKQFHYSQYINEYLDILGERFRRPWLFVDYFFRMSKLGKESVSKVDFFYNLARKVLKEKYMEREIKKKNLGLENSKQNSLMDLFIESGELTDQEILEEVVTMIAAGSETTATVFSCALAALGEHHDVQDKVNEEQRSIYGDDFLRPVTSEDLQRMTYLEQVLKEVLRLFPPLPSLFRQVTEDTDVGDGFVIPKGSLVSANVYETHHDPNIFPDPSRFDPDRFSPENCIKRHPYAFIPFGVGRRMCVGYKFAMMELKTLLSAVTRRYKVVNSTVGLVELGKNLDFGLITKSSIGYNIQIESR